MRWGVIIILGLIGLGVVIGFFREGKVTHVENLHQSGGYATFRLYYSNGYSRLITAKIGSLKYKYFAQCADGQELRRL